MDKQDTTKLSAEFFPDEFEAVGCPTCRSLFHEGKDCPQSQTKEPKFKFQSRKALGLEPGALPFKFRIEIDPEADDEAEVTRKRSLLRLNSQKIYNLMGMSVKAHESQKSALLWLARMADEMDIDDPNMQEERSKLLPLILTLQTAVQEMNRIQRDKVRQAEAMEEVATKARSTARRVRTRVAKKTQAEQKAAHEEFFVLRLPDSEVDIPVYMGEDPLELFEQAANAIRNKEKAKYEPEETDDDE